MASLSSQIIGRTSASLQSALERGVAAASFRGLSNASGFKANGEAKATTSAVWKATPARRWSSTSFIHDSPWMNATSVKALGAQEQRVFTQRVSRLYNALLAANWSDTFNLVLNVPFWESNFEQMQRRIRQRPALLTNSEIARDWIALSTLMDVMFVCEDLRDHINELNEYLDRCNKRFRTTQIPIAKMDEHLQVILDRATQLQTRFPLYKNKIDECVTVGIRLLRARVPSESAEEVLDITA